MRNAPHERMVIKASDGQELHLHRWPAQGALRGEVLIVHGYFEHGGRYAELAQSFAGKGFASVAVDLRGHGLSPGRRGYITRFDQYLDDIGAAFDTLSAPSKFMLGHSLGGLIALDFASRDRRAEQLAGLVVTNPVLEVAVPVPALKRRAGILAGALWPTLSLPSGLSPESVSRDPAIVAAYRNDPLVFGNANAGWFRETTTAQARVRALRRLEVPLLYIYSDADGVALPAANAELSAALASPDKKVWLRRGEFHEVLNELDRAALHRDVAGWMTEHLRR